MGDTWAPREGAYGRTRDGRRVGPLVRTATRREIVPGTVAVGDVTTNGGAVAISVGSGHYTADELDAAARVLTQLAGALRNG